MKRALDNPEYEPPVRDPKAIRNTVISLVAIMLLGGFLIVWKYQQKMADDYEEVKKGRSAMSLGNVRKNFQMQAIDGKVYDFTILEDKVTLIAVISVNLPKQSQIIIDEMKLAAKHFSGEERLQMVCVSADDVSKVSVDELKAFAEKAGIPEKDWYVLTANEKGYTGYIKDGLKLGMTSKVDKETKEQVLPDLLRIVDPSMKIRGEINEFMFGYYHEIEKRTQKELAENPSLLDNDEVKKRLQLHQNAVSYNRERMYKYVHYILENESYDAGFSKKNNSNRYNIPLIVFGGFILFILFMGWRVKRSRA